MVVLFGRPLGTHLSSTTRTGPSGTRSSQPTPGGAWPAKKARCSLVNSRSRGRAQLDHGVVVALGPAGPGDQAVAVQGQVGGVEEEDLPQPAPHGVQLQAGQ